MHCYNFIIEANINIGFNSSSYTVSEDNGFVELMIVKTLVSDAASTNKDNITVLFLTSNGTAQG